MKLLLPTSLGEPLPEMRDVVPIPYDPSEPIRREHHDAEALVVWGVPKPLLDHAAATLTRLRWVQSLAAGTEHLHSAGFSRDVIVTSGRGLHDGPVAEHALALLLAAARRLHTMRDAQVNGAWPGHLGGIQPVDPGASFRTLAGAHVLVWGFGSIGQRLAPYLTMLGARVTGIARSTGERAGTPVVAEVEFEELLPQADALVMILPASATTKHALNAHRLSLLPRHAWVVNVGRGSTVDELALVEALRTGAIEGAALDVFAAEPLPKASPLWTLSNVIVSPHAAGGRPVGAAELIARNVERLQRGEELQNVVVR